MANYEIGYMDYLLGKLPVTVKYDYAKRVNKSAFAKSTPDGVGPDVVIIEVNIKKDGKAYDLSPFLKEETQYELCKAVCSWEET